MIIVTLTLKDVSFLLPQEKKLMNKEGYVLKFPKEFIENI